MLQHQLFIAFVCYTLGLVGLANKMECKKEEKMNEFYGHRTIISIVKFRMRSIVSKKKIIGLMLSFF